MGKKQKRLSKYLESRFYFCDPGGIRTPDPQIRKPICKSSQSTNKQYNKGLKKNHLSEIYPKIIGKTPFFKRNKHRKDTIPTMLTVHISYLQYKGSNKKVKIAKYHTVIPNRYTALTPRY